MMNKKTLFLDRSRNSVENKIMNPTQQLQLDVVLQDNCEF